MKRRSSGLTLVESTAALAVMVPVLVAVTMAVQEVSEAFRIKQGLAQAARQAARDMAATYAQTHLLVGNKALQDSMVFDKIKVSNLVTDSSQFDEAAFDTAASPPSVKVTVRYLSNETTGLPKFPAFDPINLGASFEMMAEATYSLD